MSKVSNWIAVITSTILLAIPLAGKANATEKSLCTPEYVGGFEVKDLCETLSKAPAKSYEYQGAEVSIPDGRELVEECIQIYIEMPSDIMNEEGFSLRECFLAWM